MKMLFLTLILLILPSCATVEDQSRGLFPSQIGTWPVQSGPSLPEYLPSPCPHPSRCLDVAVGLAGPDSSWGEAYLTQGKALEFLISIKNKGSQEVTATLGISSSSCPLEWFDWTEESLVIPAGGTRSKSLLVSTDGSAAAGAYHFAVDATSACCISNSARGKFKVQELDYASETAVSGTGQFRLNKNVRSMNTGVKSNKEILFSGSVDALVKNEYLLEGYSGRNPNFEAHDAVDNYNAISPGDSLIGSESFKSSAVFGGVGARLQESYNLMQMEFESQSFNLHQTGALKKSAEFKTADNFTGYYQIDAKQIVPGQRNLAEHEEYLGSFEINRRIVFRNKDASKPDCFEGACGDAPKHDDGRRILDDSTSGPFQGFINDLKRFSQSAPG